MFARALRTPAMSLAFVVGIVLIAFQFWILRYPQQPLFERPFHLVAALVLFPLQAAHDAAAARLASLWH